jgi:hypothetical protein
MATLNCKTCGMIHPVCDPCEGPRRTRPCTTHHHACDCREREFEKMALALRIIHTWASCDHLSSETRNEAMEAIVRKCDEGLGKKAKGDQ